MQSRSSHYKFVLTSLFIAIIFLLAFTPIGFIPLGFMRATIVHVPVILGSILLGAKIGAILGAAFGMTSLIINTLMPASVLAFVFSPFIPIPGTSQGNILALIICFVPRILVGVIPYFVHKYLQRFGSISFVVAGIAGSMTNTILVLGFIYLFFRDSYALAIDIPPETVATAIMTIVMVNGVPEAILSAVLVGALGKILYARL